MKLWDVKDHQGDAQLWGPGVYYSSQTTAQNATASAELTAESCNYFQVTEKCQSQRKKKNRRDLPKGPRFNQPHSLCAHLDLLLGILLLFLWQLFKMFCFQKSYWCACFGIVSQVKSGINQRFWMPSFDIFKALVQTEVTTFVWNNIHCVQIYGQCVHKALCDATKRPSCFVLKVTIAHSRGQQEWNFKHSVLLFQMLIIHLNYRRVDVTKGYFNWNTQKDTRIYGNYLIVEYSQYSRCSKGLLQCGDSLPFCCFQDMRTKLCRFDYHSSQWSEPQSNYSSGTAITQSLSMHLITGVLTKNNRSWTPVTQNEIWRGDSEMITACKSSHKIGGYYASHSNGLFNKTLITCIILHSSLL